MTYRVPTAWLECTYCAQKNEKRLVPLIRIDPRNFLNYWWLPCKSAHSVCGSLLGNGGVRAPSSRTKFCDAPRTSGLVVLVLWRMSWSAEIIFFFYVDGYEVFDLKSEI